MEGEGERLVVVRGLDGSGVAITLINNAVSKRKHHFAGPKSPTRSVHSNVETNTDQFYCDSAAQIDGVSGRNAENLDGYYVTPSRWMECPRRSPAISRMFHNTDAFAGSLRKYPMSGNLEKSQSAEIVQRILTYAQGRNFGKRSKSKSMRSLLRRCSTHRHVSRRNRKCAGVVTDSSTWWGDRSPSDCNIDNRRDDLDLRYNYLNASISKPGMEVRYLTGVKRTICEKLRDMCDDTPKICPQMQKRLNHHKKHCNQGLAFTPTTGMKRDMEAQVSRPIETRDDYFKCMASPLSLQVKTSKACFCHTPRQCVCETTAEKRLESQNLIENELVKLYPELAYILESPFREKKDLQTIIEDEITSWVINILPFYNINLMDKNEKNQLIDHLVRALYNIDRTDSIEAKNRIKNCLYSLPALRAYEHRDIIINELSDNLLKKLRFLVDQYRVQEKVDKLVDQILSKSNISDRNKDMIKKAVVHKLNPVLINRALPEKDLEGFLAHEIYDVIKKLPVDLKHVDVECQKVTSMQEKKEGSPIVKEKEDVVLDWIKYLPELAEIPLGERKKLIAPLVESLAKENKPEIIKAKIKDWLNDVVNKGDRRLSSKAMNKLSEKLIAKLLPSEGGQVEISSHDSYGKPLEKQDTMDTVKSWFQEIPELSFRNTPENRKAVETLSKKLKGIQQEYTNPDDAQAESRKEISIWLKSMLKNNNIYLHPATVDNLVNKLVNDLQSGKGTTKRSPKSQERKNKFYEEIWIWLTELPYVDLKKIDNYKKYVVMLANNLYNIERTKHYDQSIENIVTDEVNYWINTLIHEIGLEVYEKDKQSLIKVIINKMVTAPRVRKKWHKTKIIKKELQDAVSTALASYPSTLFDKGNVISGISHLLQKNFQYEKASPKKTRAQIIKYLEKNTNLSSNDINNIANKIIHKIKRIPTAGSFKKRFTMSPKSSPKQLNVDSAQEYSEQEYSRSDSISDENIPEDHVEEKNDTLNERYPDEILAYERGRRKSFVTSTPKKEIKTSFDTILSIPSIQDKSEDIDDNDEKISQRENIKNILKNWLDELDIAEDLKNKIIDDLSEDIIDRQRYLKLSNTKTSGNLELEHLKFQIFKRLNKVISDRDLSKYMTKIKHLKTHLDSLESSDDKQFETVESLLYKDQLQFIISRNVPASVNDDSFEALKHNLADAFVSLHYSAGDEGARNEYKKIIYEEINRYCYEYLQRYPASSLDPMKLNRDLYSALIKVQAPERELLGPSYNISKIQNEIRAWLSEMLADKSSLNTESLRKNISVLANKLYYIQEKHKYQPDINVREEMLTSILDWLKHIPMTSDHKIDIKNGAKILFTNIINPTKIPESPKQPQEHSVVSPTMNKEKDALNISVMAQNAPVTSTSLNKTDNGTQYAPYLPPPSSLNAEDRAHLDMIRARSPTSSPVRRKTIHMYKDASNDLQPINISTQTEINTGVDKQTRDSGVTQAVQTPNTTIPEKSNFNVDVSPQVIVKEYLWNSNVSRQGSTILYPPRSSALNGTTPLTPAINTGAPVNVITHNRYPQQPIFIPHVEKQPNTMLQATNISTQQTSGQQQEQSQNLNVTKRIHTYNPESDKRERPPVIYEKLSQTHIETGPEQRGYFINAPNYENFSGNQRPLLSGYLTPHEQARHLERTRRMGERYVLKDNVRNYQAPYLEGQETSQRMYRKYDKYEARQARHLGQKCCRCGGRVITKCMSPRLNYHRQNDHKMCPQCFASYCPHPSPLYFNNDF